MNFTLSPAANIRAALRHAAWMTVVLAPPRSTLGDGAFVVAAPRARNNLLFDLRATADVVFWEETENLLI